MQTSASTILRIAADTIDERAKERGEISERSMALTVKMFNARWGTNLTEQQGWAFMQDLKAARNISGHKDDDLIDRVAYAALEAECVMALNKPTKTNQPPEVDNLIAKPQKLADFADVRFYIYIDGWKLIKMKECSLTTPNQLRVDVSVVPMGTELPSYFTCNWTSVKDFTDLYIPLTADTLEAAMEAYDYLTHNYIQEPK